LNLYNVEVNIAVFVEWGNIAGENKMHTEYNE